MLYMAAPVGPTENCAAVRPADVGAIVVAAGLAAVKAGAGAIKAED
jgi:hypothetical protein